jgi:hypothetical protein
LRQCLQAMALTLHIQCKAEVWRGIQQRAVEVE